MQRHLPDQEEKPMDQLTVNKKHSWRISKTSDEINADHPSSVSTRFGRRAAVAQFKQFESSGKAPLDHCDDLLEIRPATLHQKSTQHDHAGESVVTINVSGDRYQTYRETLEAYPDTLLGDENRRKHYWNPLTQEYFFDRHRTCFEAILYYYQSNGRLRRPEAVPLDTFLEEISFFQLGSDASHQVHQVENIKAVDKIDMPQALWRRYIWFHVELPQHSSAARAFHVLSTFFTVLSCVALAIESLPQYTDHWDDICKEQANMSLNSTVVPRCPALFDSPFFIIQTLCVAYFTLEFILRLLSAPSYFHFVFSFFNWVDLSAIVPYYVFLFIQLADKYIGLDTNAVLSVRILRILRFSRLFKIYLVFKRLKSLRVLSATFKESLADFAVMITILSLLAFLFGAAVYFAEQQSNGDVFDSIPKSIYWGIITITGVGYGDMCPITAVGRTLTCFCALFGSATMGMLVSVLVDRYQRVYSRRMYISDAEEPVMSFDSISLQNNDDARSVFSLQRLRRTQRASTVSSHASSTILETSKIDQHEEYDLQFLVSINDIKKESSEVDRIVTMVKKQLTEAITNTDIDVNVKLVDSNAQELWKISSLEVPTVSQANHLTLLKNNNDNSTLRPEKF